MNAMILCAGFGTRLGELTREMPKPMLDVDGRPMLAWTLAHLRGQGCRRVAVNLHFKSEVIRNHFGSGRELGIEIVYSPEPELLGTAGGVRAMGALLRPRGTFLVQYGDVVTDMNLEPMLRFHRERGALVTLLVHERTKSNSVVEFEDTGRVTRLLERPAEHERAGVPSGWVNSGLCLAEPGLLERIPREGGADLPRDVYPELIAGGKVFAFALAGYRCAVDSAARLEELRAAVREGRCRIDRPVR